jgi:hypothetical protein
LSHRLHALNPQPQISLPIGNRLLPPLQVNAALQNAEPPLFQVGFLLGIEAGEPGAIEVLNVHHAAPPGQGSQL